MLTQEQQMKLAHYMTICVLSHNGLRTYSCTEEMSARECSANIDDRAFTTYSVLYSEIFT